MPGILDPTDLTPNFLDPSGSGLFDSPEYRRQRLFDTLGGIGAALLQSGAQGNDFGTSLAMGLAGGAQAGRGAEDRIMRRMLTASQVAKNRSEMANETAWRDMFKTPISSSASPTAAPAAIPSGGGGGSSPDQATFIQMMMPHALEISKQTGLDPRLVIAQSALETGWGKSAPGNNYFGVKSHGRPGGQMLATTEAGPGGLVPTQDSFRTYADPGASAQDYIEFIKGNASRYLPVRMAQGLDAQIDAMGKSGYATDPQYGAKLRQIAQGLPADGFSPTNVPAQNIPGGLPQVAQGDTSGSPVVPVQAQQPAFRPQTMQEVIQTIPPGVRQMIGAMGRKEGMGVLMKYADPGSEAVLDTQSGQVVFIPKTMVGRDPRYQPVEGAKLNIERDKLINDQRRTDSALDNAEVIRQGGRPVLNPTIQSGKEAETQRKMLEGDYTDARKANSTAQEGGLMARQGLSNIDRLSGLLDQVSTGRFTSTTKEIKSIAKGVGVDLAAMGIKDDVAPAEAAQALSNQIALTLRNPAGGAGMPGALSDQDRVFLQQMIPSLETTPEGRKLMVEYMRRVYQRQIDIAKISNDFMRSADAKRDPMGLYTKIQEFANANPLFDPKKDVPTGGMSPMPSQGSAVRKYNPTTGRIE